MHNLYTHKYALLIDENHISVCYRTVEKRSSYVNWFTLTLARIIKYALARTHTYIHTTRYVVIYVYTISMGYRVLCSSPTLRPGYNNRGAEPPEGTLLLLFYFFFLTLSPR